MTVCQEGEGGPAAGVGVVDEGEDGDGLVEALLLDERVDGAGVLAVLDVELVHAAAPSVASVRCLLCRVVTEECVQCHTVATQPRLPGESSSTWLLCNH